MTTAAPIKPAVPFPARAPGGASSAAAPSVDIGKMLKKYAWILIASVIFGALLGAGAFFVLRQVYPIFRPQVVFQVLPPQSELREIQTASDQDEQERFALTEVAFMKSDDVIQRVVSDPRLLVDGGSWTEKFKSRDGRFNQADAAEWLQENLSTRLVPKTDIIEMKLGWTDAGAITNVLGLVRENYMLRLEARTRDITAPQREALERQITTYQERLDDRQRLREQVLRDDKVDSLEQRWASENLELQGIIAELHNVRNTREAVRSQLTRYERELNAEGGPTYSDELVQAVEADPQILNIKQTISSLETQRDAMKRRGIGPDHRAMRTTIHLIDSWESELERKRQELLRLRFAAIIDSLRNLEASEAAKESSLVAAQERLVTRLIDYSRTLSRIDDIDNEIAGILKTRGELEASLQNLSSISRLATAKRVTVLQAERVPDRPVFPNIVYMIPAGIVLCLGLTTGIVFLRELLDQRVKGPADVSLIPRTRVLGFVPDAGEDTDTRADQVHRAFTAAPRGVLAESFRQIRSPLLKQMDLAGHRSVMVMCGMPGSGASVVSSNLAEAAAAAGKRVLLMDANFRRPSQHKYFGVPEAPGLADVLACETTVENAAQATQTPGLSILPAGTAGHRIVERLATEKFSEVLAAAGAAFDLVVIDVPPAVVAGDGLSIANRCDASVLVVKAYSEKRGLVARLRNQLADAKAEFLGVVVNGVKASAGGYLRGNIRATQEYAREARKDR